MREFYPVCRVCDRDYRPQASHRIEIREVNFWQALGGLVLLAVVGLGIEFAVFLKANHDERMKIVEQQQQKEQATIERKCKAKFPRSGANRRNCIEGDL